MKIYAAAIYTNNLAKHGQVFNRLTPREQKALTDVKHVLESYHYVQKQSYVDKMRRDQVRIFLDSGAFSAHTQGVAIDLDAYIAYAKSNKDFIEFASVLDDLGNAQKTYDNQIYMERHGVPAIPCFHYGEDERWLAHYVSSYAYISLGGVALASGPQLVKWLDRIWHDYLCDEDGRPRVRVHGFGLTRLDLMFRYPWHSVDSTSWMSAGANGLLILPPDFRKFAVSIDSTARHKDNAHFDTLSEPEKWVVYNKVNDRGFDFARCQNTYLARWAFNLNTFAETNVMLADSQAAGHNTFNNPQMGIFPV